MKVKEHDTIVDIINRNHQVNGRKQTARIVEVQSNLPTLDHQRKGNIPSHSVIVWMLCVQRLPTRVRLKIWGIVQEVKCVFCDENESMDHFFFKWCYSWAVWRKILMYNRKLHQLKRWKEELAELVMENDGKSLKNKMMQLSFCYAIYHIWLERNGRAFGGKERIVENLVFTCITAIKNRVYSWKNFSYTKANWEMCIEWNFSLQILRR
ncbi:hypothetical protein LIER_42709 [Lithospermum erythrorhizon]|uniref:Reverse transcriptase zinc-binding domain-containing protein n=1 Tax=Lithospermum erythrorhizon TaxID=34254 RepID=A0AAV3NSQ7_LITER